VPESDTATQTTGRRWRIDDLAQEAGTTVDTVRFYVREGLLSPGEKSGRVRWYGAGHLDRLLRIRELQDRRFSLAAIKALLDTDRPGLEELFATRGREHSFADLVAATGLDAGLVRRFQDVGLLADPAAFGHETYDDDDLGLLRAVAVLQDIGMTEDILVALAEIYVRHFTALQADVHAMFAGHDRDWDPAELDAVQRRLTASTDRMIPAVDVVLNYVHQRTVQRLTLEAVRTAEATGTGVGGIRVDKTT
jgi:DNA-binding transcriptional MerR regulator